MCSVFPLGRSRDKLLARGMQSSWRESKEAVAQKLTLDGSTSSLVLLLPCPCSLLQIDFNRINVARGNNDLICLSRLLLDSVRYAIV